MLTTLHLFLIPLTFALGAAVGSFVNVCVYRIPWQKSLIWPSSHCPRCRNGIAPRDNLPILGWVFLRGRCRSCGLPISARYPFVEALVGLLFVAVYLVDVAARPDLILGDTLVVSLLRAGFHQILIAFLVTATFIDYDLMLIPDEITVPGMAIGLGVGTLLPWLRTDPATATTLWGGFLVGITGFLIGGGLVWIVRFLGTLAFRREAMGFGDVTLMAMVGSFLGWEAAVLTFFVAPFLGLAHAFLKVLLWVRKALGGQPIRGADRELPFGPYLSMAAVTLLLSWPWLWPGYWRGLFHAFRVVFLFLTGQDDLSEL